MKILIEMKQELRQAMRRFEEKEVKISMKDSQDILKLEKVIESAESPSVLKQSLKDHLKNIEGKFFAFLGIRNDLKYELISVLNQDKYDMTALLMAECIELRSENSKLNFFVQSRLLEANVTIEKLTEENTDLKNQLCEQEIAHQQAEKVAKLQIKQLTEVAQGFEEEKRKLQSQLEKSEMDKAELYEENIKYINEIKVLKNKIKSYTRAQDQGNKIDLNQQVNKGERKYYTLYG
jgi:hypothetical protein